MADVFLEQSIRNISILISEGKYKDAFGKLSVLMQSYPNNSQLHALKRKIQQEVLIENNKLIERELPKVKDLVRSQDFAKALNQLRDLKKYNPAHKELLKLLTKVQVKYIEESEKQKKIFMKSKLNYFNKILLERPNDLLDELYVFNSNNVGNKVAMQISNKMRDKLIEKLIDDQKDLLYSDKFDAIKNFMSRLKAIDPDNSRIKELEPLLLDWKLLHQTDKKREFLYKGLNHLETLMKLKKYDKALKVSTELLDLEPESKKLKNAVKKAESHLFSQTRSESAELIKSAQKKLKEELRSNPKSFIQI